MSYSFDSKRSKRVRGIIVWDFDGVLFETERYRIDNRDAFRKIGIPTKVILDILPQIGKGGHFSIARFIAGLRSKNIFVSEKKIRRVYHDNILNSRYYSPKTDLLLHQLRKKGFLQMILSAGHSSFQRKKMFVGCGKNFRKHFVKIMVTTKPKYLTLLKIQKKDRNLPLIFVDDTKENLELVNKHVPGIKTIHYSNLSGTSLKTLEKKILLYAKK